MLVLAEHKILIERLDIVDLLCDSWLQLYEQREKCI